MTKTFLVQANGAVSVSKEELETLVPASRYPQILAMMKDPNSSQVEVLLLIHSEIINLIMKLKECGSDAIQTKKGEQYLKQICALSAAAETYLKSKPAEDGDQLNFDGPKFQFVLGGLVGCMEEAARNALGKNSDEMCQKIMTKFHDIRKKEEPRLRQEVLKIGSTIETKVSDSSESGKG
jgi:hypothetical protein